jgi:hypothetical protein
VVQIEAEIVLVVLAHETDISVAGSLDQNAHDGSRR